MPFLDFRASNRTRGDLYTQFSMHPIVNRSAVGFARYFNGETVWVGVDRNSKELTFVNGTTSIEKKIAKRMYARWQNVRPTFYDTEVMFPITQKTAPDGVVSAFSRIEKDFPGVYEWIQIQFYGKDRQAIINEKLQLVFDYLYVYRNLGPSTKKLGLRLAEIRALKNWLGSLDVPIFVNNRLVSRLLAAAQQDTDSENLINYTTPIGINDVYPLSTPQIVGQDEDEDDNDDNVIPI